MTPEKEIQIEILRQFATRSELRLWRANTGMAVPLGSERVVQFGVRGQADLSGIVQGGRRLEIEVKSPRGRRSVQQVRWGEMIARFGGIYIIARCVNDVYAGLSDAGFELPLVVTGGSR